MSSAVWLQESSGGLARARGDSWPLYAFIQQREEGMSKVWRGRSVKVDQPVSNPLSHAAKFMKSSAGSFEFQ